MKRCIINFFGCTIIILISVLFLTINSEQGTYSVYASSSGSPGAKTGSPGDANSCTQCHSGILNPGTAVASITAPGLSGGYVPGQTYTITAAISGTTSSKIGFEVTAERDLNSAKTGVIVITNSTRTKTVNLGKAITHNSGAGSSASGGANSWSFDWTAPVAGTGSVTFYGSFNATNSNGNTSGDQVYTASLNVTEDTGVDVAEQLKEDEFNMYPNPAVSILNLKSASAISRIEIYALSGEKVLDENQPRTYVNIRNLENGVYLVKIFLDKNVIINKLIKQ